MITFIQYILLFILVYLFNSVLLLSVSVLYSKDNLVSVRTGIRVVSHNDKVVKTGTVPSTAPLSTLKPRSF